MNFLRAAALLSTCLMAQGCGEDATPGGESGNVDGGENPGGVDNPGGEFPSDERICQEDSDCTTENACHVGSCDPASRVCTWSLLDGDQDGNAPRVCGGTDCNDENPDIPADTEIPDNDEDDNCNGEIDESEEPDVVDDPPESECTIDFSGTWEIQYDNLQAVDYEYEFGSTMSEQDSWRTKLIALEQTDCSISKKTLQGSLDMFRDNVRTGDEGIWVRPPPDNILAVVNTGVPGDDNHFMEFVGALSEDQQTVTGDCSGEYWDREVETHFQMTCSFILTRKD